MVRQTLILCITIIAGSPGAIAGEKSMFIDPLELRINAFAKKIDFNRAILNHVATEKVIFDWKKIGIPKHLAGWMLVDDRYFSMDGKHAREVWEWAYTKKEKGIAIRITSYKTGNQAALLAIRDFATMSNGAEPPYAKGPSDLGTISLALPDKYGYTLHWAYRDLQFKLEATDKDVALKTAYWLNSIAEDHRRSR